MIMNIKFFALKNAVAHNGKASPEAIVPKVLGEDSSLKNDMKKLMADINKVVLEVNKMGIEEQKKELLILDAHALDKKEEAVDLPEIPGIIKGKCSFRLPPGPEKQLHVGHALSFLLNEYYAKRYDGKLILRFEDTNPEKSKQEFVQGIREDLKALGIKYDEEYFLSDNMQDYYKYADSLIKAGFAYACICPKNESNDECFEKKRCSCADKDINCSLRHWNKMRYGTYKEGECVIRLKGEMKSKNSAMWDPVIFRINKVKHYRQGSKYFAWPVYDFTASIEDSKITHVLRDSNWTQRVELQDYIREKCGITAHPVNVLYSRYEIEGGLTKGREIRRLVNEGIVEGYDDIRLSTIKGMLKKGIQPETLRELVIDLGVSKSKKHIPMDKVYAINRKVLEKTVKHYQAINAEDAVILKVKEKGFIIPKLPKDAKIIRLKNSFNVIISRIGKDEIIGEHAGEEFSKDVPIIPYVDITGV